MTMQKQLNLGEKKLKKVKNIKIGKQLKVIKNQKIIKKKYWGAKWEI